MKLLVDGAPLALRPTGVGRYVRELLQEMLRLEKSLELVVVAEGAGALVHPRVRHVRLPPGFRKIARVGRMLGLEPPLDFFSGRVDGALFPNYFAPRLARQVPSFVWVHDVSFLLAADTVEPRLRRDLQGRVPRSLRACANVITLSESVKRELGDHLAVAAARVTVAPPAVDTDRFRRQSLERVAEVRARLSLPDRYVLYTGTIEPRKNLARLIAAFHQLGPEARRGHELVLVGGAGWLDGEIREAITQTPGVRHVGWVDEEDLAAVFSGAGLFAFPSLYEGFGMPPLEAMACGVPVVASTAAAVREACGDAAILVDALDVAGISSGLARVLGDDGLRAALVERGHRNVARFSWSASARTVLDAVWSRVGNVSGGSS